MMMVARVESARRRGYGESGLRCLLGCSRFFDKAGEFVLHPCWQSMREKDELTRRAPDRAHLSTAQQLLLIPDLQREESHNV